MQRSPSVLRALCLSLVVLTRLTDSSTPLPAGEIKLKNGLVIPGIPGEIPGLTLSSTPATELPTQPGRMWVVYDGVRRYFVSKSLIPRDRVDFARELNAMQSFKLQHSFKSRNQAPTVVGAYSEILPFSEFGRRFVKLNTPNGPLQIEQAIVELRPDFLKIESTTHKWAFGLATRSLPSESLVKLLESAIDRNKSDDRLGLARFYRQADLYKEADAEMQAIERDFPDLKERIAEERQELHQSVGRAALLEIRQRRLAGQHTLAFDFASRFPREDIAAATLREVDELSQNYRESQELARKAESLLGELQAKIDDPELARQFAPLRTKLLQELHYETVHRLDPFLRAEQDASLAPKQKLALAYSGWVLGSTYAETDPAKAIALWNVRSLVLDYLRSEDQLDRSEALEQLRQIDDATPQNLSILVKLLTPPLDTRDILPTTVSRVEVPSQDSTPATHYSVYLPMEYNPHHEYPLLVILHPLNASPEAALRFWATMGENPGIAPRRGYIAIAPEYLPATRKSYDYSADSHQAILLSIRDALLRFRIDSDRVFLTGHGMGGDAACDIGMSHPDLFAGVIPITAVIQKYARHSWKNAPDLAWYFVGGELDRDTLEINAPTFTNMMSKKHDILYCEYVQRGFETYFEELERIFDWMDLLRRPKIPREFEVSILRDSDNFWHWVQPNNFPAGTLLPVAWDSASPRVNAQKLSAKITPGNSVSVSTSAKSCTLWLSPDLVDFKNPIKFKYRTQNEGRLTIKPDIEHLLFFLQLRGDRNRLVWAKHELR